MEIEIIDAHNNTSHAAFLWIYTFIVDMANETHTYRINRRSSIAQIFHRIYHIHRNHINKHNTSDNFFAEHKPIWTMRMDNIAQTSGENKSYTSNGWDRITITATFWNTQVYYQSHPPHICP